MSIPPAIHEMIWRYFGDAALPDYSRTLSVINRNPYRQVRDELARQWVVRDITDYNYDLAFVYVLQGHPQDATVRLSAVGPFALATSSTGEPLTDSLLNEILQDNGFAMLNKELLERHVDIWEPEVSGTLYEFLFEFDHGLPWAR